MTVNIELAETEFAGAQKIRHVDVEVTSYEQGGETVTPADLGMNRFQKVHVDAVEPTSVRAKFARQEQAVYLFDGGTEAAGGTTEQLRVMAVGR